MFSACTPEPTPTPQSGSEILKGVYSEDLILEDISEGVDYTLDGNVEIKALLTIKPGVTITCKNGASLLVKKDGAISAIGTSLKPIVFKGELPGNGFWKGIAITSSDERNEFNHLVLSDAGSAPIDSDWNLGKAGITVLKLSEKGKLSIKNSDIKNCNGYGLIVDNDSEITNFANNTFKNIISSAMCLGANQVKNIGGETTFINNGFDGVEIRYSELNEASVWAGIDYFIKGDKLILKEILNIEAGAKLVFNENSKLEVLDNGVLTAIGTPSNQITFTGLSNSNSSWAGIIVYSASDLNKLHYCNISFGGSDAASPIWASDVKANIALLKTQTTSSMSVENCQITGSGGYGIFVGKNCDLTESNNTFDNNELYDIYYDEYKGFVIK
ncbi:MAG: hypothetical protein CSA94_00800 [Bacteroidetes bacterium]|nr:MAG: hypothetical protein CSA94_00800 [Bacteroidota bacterium]